MTFSPFSPNQERKHKRQSRCKNLIRPEPGTYGRPVFLPTTPTDNGKRLIRHGLSLETPATIGRRSRPKTKRPKERQRERKQAAASIIVINTTIKINIYKYIILSLFIIILYLYFPSFPHASPPFPHCSPVFSPQLKTMFSFIFILLRLFFPTSPHKMHVSRIRAPAHALL